MCGICGFTWRDEDKLRAMTDSLQHRGPDGTGAFVDDRVSLGHTRLSILDLTESGRQPMASDDGDVVVTFNGEIYNFQEIRKELESRGRSFRGTSDTEVVVESWREWGVEAFSRFNGMWALAIYDKQKGVLVLSRDRIGVKPLYYSADGTRLVFASELKAILQHDIDRTVNTKAVDLLLSTQFIPSPMSIFERIFKLEPRHYLTFELATGRLTKHCYYDIPRYAPVHDKERLLAEGRALLEDATKLRLVADVPVGAFLSGGIDSTTVVALMRKYVAADHLNTVSVGFDVPGLDESEFIDIAKDLFRTRHHHITFRLDDGEKFTDELFRAYDEPVADPSSFPTFRLCQETRKWMTVALSGDGGDEAFGGYPGRQVVVQFAMLRRVPHLVRRAAHAVLAKRYGYAPTGPGKLAEALRVSLLPAHEYAAEIGASFVHRPEAFKAWAREKLKELLPLSGGDLTEAMLKFDIYYNRLGDNYAAKVDRMSMAHSLEVRSPFLDYRVMEFGARIPVRWKITRRGTKILLKEMVRGLIPDRIIDREKHGFAGPLGAWVDRNEPALRAAVVSLHEAGVLSDAWRAFYVDRVFADNHSVYREYRKRLFFLWKWHQAWGRARLAPVPAA